jgi:hypothetical protein
MDIDEVDNLVKGVLNNPAYMTKTIANLEKAAEYKPPTAQSDQQLKPPDSPP